MLITPAASQARLIGLHALVTVVLAADASAFVAVDRWDSTATVPSGILGEAITLTWSIVPDGTAIPNRGSSSLVSLLDEALGGDASNGDLTSRPWFPVVQSAFNRWSELGGVEFVYEPHDDGATHRSTPGQLGVRGDVRLAGSIIDGPGGTSAVASFPNAGDIVLDVSEAQQYGDTELNHLRLRNTLMHELGHSLGLGHVRSADADMLLEPALTISFDGPQAGDIRGLHFLYGDQFESANQGRGNDSLEDAISVGAISPGEQLFLGTRADAQIEVDPQDSGYLSLSQQDHDYYLFQLPERSTLDALLTPQGGKFHQTEAGGNEIEIDASASVNLAMTLLDADGDILAHANDRPRGWGEEFNDLLLNQGDYYIRVSGSRESVQLYTLQLHANASHAPEPHTWVLTALCASVILGAGIRGPKPT